MYFARVWKTVVDVIRRVVENNTVNNILSGTYVSSVYRSLFRTNRVLVLFSNVVGVTVLASVKLLTTREPQFFIFFF